MKGSGGQFQTVIGKVVGASSALTVLLGALIVTPLTLWFAWVHRSTVAYSVLQSLFCLSFAWGLVSLLKAQRGLRRLSASERIRVLSGPRPDDPDELYVWKWAWQFMFAVIAVALSMIAIPITASLIAK